MYSILKSIFSRKLTGTFVQQENIWKLTELRQYLPQYLSDKDFKEPF